MTILESKAGRVAELMPLAEAKSITPAAIMELLRLIVAAYACLKKDPIRAADTCHRPPWLARRRIGKIAARQFGDRSPGIVDAVLAMGREITAQDIRELNNG